MANRSLGSLTIDLIAKIGGWTDGLSKAERELDSRTRRMNKMANDFGRNIGSSLKAAAAGFLAFAGVAVSLDAFASGIKGAIDRADQLRDASIRLGVGVETLSAFGYAAQQTGTDLEELNKGLLRLSRNAQEALNPKSRQAKLFEALGIDRDSLSDLDRLVPQIADKFAQLQDGAQKAAVAQELFGRSGANLIEFLNQGSGGLSTMADRARELGIIIDSETAAAADEFNDKLADLKASGTGLATQVASELLPQLTQLVDWATDFVSDGDNARQIADDVAAAMRGLADAIQLVLSVGTGLSSVRESLAGAENAWRSFIGNFGANGVVSKALKDVMPWAYKTIGGGPDFSNVQGTPNPFANVRGGSDTVSAGGTNSALDKFFATGGKTGGGSKTRKQQLTDEEKEAKRLQETYDRMNESLAQQIALFGQDGEAAQVRYEVEHGELSKLTQAQKDGLIVQAERLDQMREEAEVQKELDQINQRRTEQVEALLSDLEYERSLLGQTAEVQEVLNNLRWAGVDANSAYGQSIITATEALQEQRTVTERQIELMDEFRGGLVDGLSDIVTGAKSAKDAFKDFFDDMAARITRMIAERWIEQLFGQQGSTSGGASGGGWIQAIASIFAGGRASGGWTAPNRLYEVNEHGFEMATVGGRDYMLTGPEPVYVTPNHRLGGGGSGDTFNFQFEAPTSTRTQAQLAGRVQYALGRNQRNR